MDWEQIIERHGSRVLIFARQWVPSRADAEDAVQDGITRVFRSGSGTEKNIVPVLYRSVKWAALDQNRKRERRLVREEASRGDADTAWFESGLERDERREDVEAALRGLSPEQREVVVMKIWGELTFRQIAVALSIAPGTAASRYRYGVDALRKALTPEGELCHGSV